MKRSCSGCTLCCKLLPIATDAAQVERVESLSMEMIRRGLMTEAEYHATIPDFEKPAGKRCPHQRTGKGCAVYAKRPFGCRWWSCRWLGDPEGTRDLPRPDRCGYVIDVMPDFITVTNNDTREEEHVEVIQVWVDPKRPDCHRDPRLLAFLEREGKVALIRLNAREAFTLWPPALTGGRGWQELTGQTCGRTHTLEEKVAALGATVKVVIDP